MCDRDRQRWNRERNATAKSPVRSQVLRAVCCCAPCGVDFHVASSLQNEAENYFPWSPKAIAVDFERLCFLQCTFMDWPRTGLWRKFLKTDLISYSWLNSVTAFYFELARYAIEMFKMSHSTFTYQNISFLFHIHLQRLKLLLGWCNRNK